MKYPVYIKNRITHAPQTVTNSVGSAGSLSGSRRYQENRAENTIGSDDAGTKMVKAPSGRKRGIKLFEGNARDIFLDQGSYLGAIPANSSHVISLYWTGSRNYG